MIGRDIRHVIVGGLEASASIEAEREGEALQQLLARGGA
ncbi:hypothetical protein SAMN05519103_05993 [Rhizobiales bacterium GAS113]|nr:hypothetical protein SAMN05519103_05993 [Rhizobiales bacterium GAS113]SEF06452.1 hypothetical protein SAMN05519104_8212 [Rhizobiales bacterium GAS188]